MAGSKKEGQLLPPFLGLALYGAAEDPGFTTWVSRPLLSASKGATHSPTITRLCLWYLENCAWGNVASLHRAQLVSLDSLPTDG